MPLSTLPAQPGYCRCTPGVFAPFSALLVSSTMPAVPSAPESAAAANARRSFRRIRARTAASSQTAAARNHWSVRTAVPARWAGGSGVLRLSSDSRPRQ